MILRPDVLQWASAGLALLAAALSLWSARVRVPKAIRHIDFGFVDPTKPKPIDDFDHLTSGLKKESVLGLLAAAAAAVSAALQLLVLLAPP